MSKHDFVEDGTTLILTPNSAKHTASVILMHGLGDTAEGWIDTAAEYLAPALPHAKFILPTATTRPITVNMGMPMPGWYDIEHLGRSRTLEKCDGIQASSKRIQDLIAAEKAAGIADSRIMLAGFSQGGAMSLFVGLNYPQRLAGLSIMSGYMPLPDAIKPTAEALTTPVAFFHGDEDMVVPLDFAEDAHERLKGMGMPASNISFKKYAGLPHSANAAELRDVLAFMRKHLPAEVGATAAAPAAAGGGSGSAAATGGAGVSASS